MPPGWGGADTTRGGPPVVGVREENLQRVGDVSWGWIVWIDHRRSRTLPDYKYFVKPWILFTAVHTSLARGLTSHTSWPRRTPAKEQLKSANAKNLVGSTRSAPAIRLPRRDPECTDLIHADTRGGFEHTALQETRIATAKGATPTIRCFKYKIFSRECVRTSPLNPNASEP